MTGSGKTSLDSFYWCSALGDEGEREKEKEVGGDIHLEQIGNVLGLWTVVRRHGQMT